MTRLSVFTPFVLLCSLLAFGPAFPALAEPGATGPILLGQSCALSGPASNLGQELRLGLMTALMEINENGGVNGREILLESLDDGYEPYRAVKNAERLIGQPVFALIGEVGTPTAQAILPLVNEHRIPLFSPYTGAEFLREPFNPLIINIRRSYSQEIEKLLNYLVDNRGVTRIACFYQNDSYGYTGLAGLQQALLKRTLPLIGTGSYERNTVAVLGALSDIEKLDPEAVVMIGTYTACSEFIKLHKVRNPGKDVYYGNISFVGTTNLQKALGPFGERVIVTQVVPFPWNRDIPLVAHYQESLERFRPGTVPGFVSLEGYIAGKLFAHVAGRVEGDLTRASFLTALGRLGKISLEGLTLEYHPRSYIGSDEINLVRIYPNFEQIVY